MLDESARIPHLENGDRESTIEAAPLAHRAGRRLDVKSGRTARVRYNAALRIVRRTHLYAGLYLDSQGDSKGALVHLTEASDPKYAEYGGFMNVAAHVHRNTLVKSLPAAK